MKLLTDPLPFYIHLKVIAVVSQAWKIVNSNTYSSEKQLIILFFTEISPAVHICKEGSKNVAQQ